MTTSGLSHSAVIALILAVCLGQATFAEQAKHSHMIVIPSANSQALAVNAGTVAPGLYAVTQGFHGTPYPNWINNADGTELWPCYGNSGEVWPQLRLHVPRESRD